MSVGPGTATLPPQISDINPQQLQNPQVQAALQGTANPQAINPENLPQVDAAVTGDVPINLLNAQAQQLVGTAFQTYGGLPNPRAAVEAMQTNSAPAVAAAMQVGSSAFDSILNSSPIGAPLQNLATRQPQGKQQPLQTSSDESAMVQDWRSLGDMPVADTRWLSKTLQSKDPGAIKKWQNYLNAEQWYTGQTPLNVSGHWDQQSTASLYSFLIARFTPTALYSQDQAARNRATTFLSAIGYDVNGINAQMGNDPAWKNQIVIQWMHTHGPDISMRNSLNEWSSLYGDANMSDAVKSLKENWLQDLTDGIPLIGSLMPWSSAHQADLSKTTLNAAEKAALAPALQDAQNSMGIFGILNGYDQARTKAILGVKYFFQDLFTQGKVENPWDPNTSSGLAIQTHANNLFAGLFGDKAAADNPTVANVANLFMNIADDPISYIGIGLDSKLVSIGAEGEPVSLGAKLRIPIPGTDKVLRGGMAPARAALLKPAVIRDAFHRGEAGAHILDTVLQPMNRLRQETARMLGTAPWNDIAHASALIGERNPARLHLVEEIIKEQDPGRRAELLRQYYAYKIHDPSFAMNMMEAMKAYSPKIWSRLSEGKQARLWWGGVGRQMNRGRQINIDDPFELRDAIHMQGVAWGLEESKVWQLMNKALHSSMVVRRQAVLETNEAIRAHLETFADKGEGFRQWVNNVRGGSRGFNADDQQFYLAIKDPGGHIVEGSRKGTGSLTEDEKKLLAGHDNDIEQAIAALKERLVELRQSVGDQHPEFAEAQKLTEQQIQDLRDTQKGVAAFSPQFNMWERWDYTPYETLAYKSPVLRNADYVQRKLKVDSAMGLWKRSILMKPSSSLSIMLGDETTRFLISALMDGRPQDVAKYFVNMVKAKMGRGDITELPRDLMFNAAKMFGEYHWDDHIPYDVGDVGYPGAIEHFVNDLVAGGPEAKVWTKAIKEAGGTRAEQQSLATERLVDWLTGTTKRKGSILARDPDAAEYLRRAGIDPNLALSEKDQALLEKLRALNTERGATEGEAAAASAAAVRVQNKIRKQLEPVAKQIHAHFQSVTKYSRGSREDIFNWVDEAAQGKRMHQDDVKKLVHRLRQTDPDALPVAVGRRLFAPGSPGATPFARMSNWYFHHVTDALVNNQRRVGYGIKLKQYEQQIRAFHGGDWTEDEILNQAASEARQWVMKNTYQGARSMMATANRNMFPFFGATANMSKFFLRQWARHPATIDPSMRFLAWQQQNSLNGGIHIPVPGVTNLLSTFGFNSGDDLTFDPSYAFFFSRDGLAGYLPGLGPLAMIPVKMAAQANPDVANTLKQVPGYEYVDYNSPMIPWFERGVSALSIAMTGKSVLEGVPLLGRGVGYYSRQELDAAQQQHAQYMSGQRSTDASQGSVNAQVAAETGLQSILQFATPLNFAWQDPIRAKITPAVKAFDAAVTDPQKLTVINANPDAAPLLLYYSPELWNKLHPDQAMQDQDVRRTLVDKYPWLQAYATGKVASAAPGTQSGAETSLASYEQDLVAGRLRYLGTDEFIGKMLKNDEFNSAWSQYETIHQGYLSWLVQSGASPNSTQAAQYRALYVDPVVQSIGRLSPDWYKQFVTQTSTSPSGLDVASAPLRSLMSWEVMPQFDGFNDATANLWRTALVWRDNAATAITAARGNTGEQQMILYQLQLQYAQLAAQDPTGTFGAQLSRFSFSKLSDLVKLESADQYAQQQYGVAPSA